MKRYISALSMKLPAGFKKRSLRWIKDNFDLDFLEDDKMDCEAAGLEFVGYATPSDYDGAYCVVARDIGTGEVGCYITEFGRMFKITSPDEMY